MSIFHSKGHICMHMQISRAKSAWSQRSTVWMLGFATLVALVSLLAAGCGGGGTCGTCPGAAAGWVYQPVGGGAAIVSADLTPPVGYEPVPAGTAVWIDGYPELTTTTDADGRYYIVNIPSGTHVLVIEAPAGTIRLSIPIICGRITLGGGHQEGGGGLG